MKEDSKQVQKSGNDSINFQANSITINRGLTYEEVKSIALDVFNNNFYKLSAVAKDTAARRAQEITEVFLKKLEERNPKAVGCAEDPDFQHSLFTVQKEYARSGDKDMGNLLVDILVERTKAEEKSLLQIVLNESLAVAPKLTNSQLNALAIVFRVRYAFLKKGLCSLNTLTDYLNIYFSPFVEGLPISDASYQHLEYCGCGTILERPAEITEHFTRNYPGLFTMGFPMRDFDHEFSGIISGADKIFRPCMRNDRLWQFDAISLEELKELIESKKISSSTTIITRIQQFWKRNLIADPTIKAELIVRNPKMATLYDVWEKSVIKNMTLTSAGIALAHAYTRAKIQDYAGPLSNWIN